MYEGKWTALTVRKTFFEYFEQRGHTIGAIEQSYHPMPSHPPTSFSLGPHGLN